MKKLIFLGASCLLIFACKKDQQPSTSIIMGDVSSMNVTLVNTTLEACSGCFNTTYVFDANDDEITDFRFYFIESTTSLGSRISCSIASENDQAFFLRDKFKQDIYRKEDTLYADTSLQSGQTTVRYVRTFWSCAPLQNEDTVFQSWTGLPEGLDETANLSVNDQDWSSNSDLLTSGPLWNKFGDLAINHPDTAEQNLFYSNNICTTFEEDVIKYIPIKIGAGGVDRLGWIKVKLSGNQLFIYEYALQNLN